MSTPGERNKKRVFSRVPGGMTRTRSKGKKRKAATCPVTKHAVHGTPSAKVKRRTKKRPSAPFGGVLSGKARARAIEQAVLVKEGIKPIEAVDLQLTPYVKQLMATMEKTGR